MTKARLPLVLTLLYFAGCIAFGLVLLNDGADAGQVVLAETWLVIFYLAACGVVLGVVPLFRRYVLKRSKG